MSHFAGDRLGSSSHAGEDSVDGIQRVAILGGQPAHTENHRVPRRLRSFPPGQWTDDTATSCSAPDKGFLHRTKNLRDQEVQIRLGARFSGPPTRHIGDTGIRRMQAEQPMRLFLFFKNVKLLLELYIFKIGFISFPISFLNKGYHGRLAIRRRWWKTWSH